MSVKSTILAITISAILIITIFELVRRRKLNEEYSWLWMLTGFVILILSIWEKGLTTITSLIGAVLNTSTLFFFGIIFVMLISLHFSVVLSGLTNKIKKLAQQIALLEGEMRNNHETK
ncbi:DUF2304 domain-containing protein [bacterium]|nr:DUF2304 domain-containing protein [bacterium]MBU1753117.1 DUF2304 domain-containing protein [bacterium]